MIEVNPFYESTPERDDQRDDINILVIKCKGHTYALIFDDSPKQMAIAMNTLGSYYHNPYLPFDYSSLRAGVERIEQLQRASKR